MKGWNPLGKLPGSVWTIPTQPLTVPPELGVDHFAAYPMEWPRRIIQGWTPTGICTVCGEGRRPVTHLKKQHGTPRANGAGAGRGSIDDNQRGMNAPGDTRPSNIATITGYACGCTLRQTWTEPLYSTLTGEYLGEDERTEYDFSSWAPAPTRPSVVCDPFGGTGTTALVAKALGRTGITVDLSADYCRLAEWRCNDPRELAAALQVEKPDVVPADQLSLFETP